MMKISVPSVSVLALLSMTACGGDPADSQAETSSRNPVLAAPAHDGAELTSTSTAMVDLGRRLYFDTNLSVPAGQSCASCHLPSSGYADPDRQYPTSEGAVLGRFGGRNSPSAAYAKFSPALYYDTAAGMYVGGQFWDGRVSSLEDQAKGPFLNPLEMNNPDKASVVSKVRASAYASLFLQVFGPDAFNDVNLAYDRIARAIAEFERSPAVSPFTSKFDGYLRGLVQLSALEKQGLALFNDPSKGNCALCHLSKSVNGVPPLFTDFSYDNLGVPKNPRNPFYYMPAQYNPDGKAWVDRGLGAVLGLASEEGKFKIPTLRNIALTAPYMHNGYFADLRSVVNFYNTRDVATWPAPEVAANVNHVDLGNLGLTSQEVDAIVAFMLTLTDGYIQ